MPVFWDVDGNIVIEQEKHNELANLLDSVDGESTSVARDVAAIAKSLEQITREKPESLAPRSSEDSNVLDAVFPKGVRYRVKLFSDASQKDDIAKRIWKKTMSRERAMMEWMSARTRVPLPKVLSNEVSSTGTAYMITEYPRGTPIYGHFSGLSDDQKQANLQSYVDLTLSMFRTPCPSYIGSIVAISIANDTARLGPCIHPFDASRAPAVFERIEDYFGWLLQNKRTLMAASIARAHVENDGSAVTILRTRLADTKADRELAKIRRAFARLEVHLAEAIRNLDKPLLRCVPVNEHLGPRNVCMDAEGQIADVVDWSAHVVKPAILAAAYPSWLSYPDRDHPQLNARDGRYMESPEDAERLCVWLDLVLLQRDVEYYNALKEGIFMRKTEAWLKDPKSDLEQLQAVMSHAVVNMV